tara:strand:- start:1366 stop:1476 length:111 start_codon:yes stop_codon:yes gene_type:complete
MNIFIVLTEFVGIEEKFRINLSITSNFPPGLLDEVE